MAAALAASGLGVFVCERVAGVFQADAFCRRLWGWDATGPVSWDQFVARIDPADRAKWDQALGWAWDPHNTGQLCAEVRLARLEAGPETPPRWVLVTGQVAFTEGQPARLTGLVQELTQAKASERALFAANERLRALMESVPIGISFSTDPTCRHITGNATVLAQFEAGSTDNISACATDPQSPGRRVRYFLRGQELSAAELPMQRAVTENRVIPVMELEVVLPSGRRWFCDASGAPLRDPEGRVVGAVALTVDVTNRVQSKATAASSQEQFRRAVLGAPFPMMVHAEDGEVLLVNPLWSELTGYGPEELATIADWTELAYGERKGSVRADIDRLYSLGQRLYEGEYVITTRSGDQRTWDFSSAPLGRLPDGRRMVLSMAADITEKKQALDALARSEERIRLALDAAHIGTFDWDLPQNRLVWSRWHEQLWGFAPGEFGGTFEAFASRIHPDDLPGINETVARCIAARAPFEREYRVLWPDNSLHWIAGAGEFSFDQQGQAVRMRGTVREITARKQAEEQLQASEARLRFALEQSRTGGWDLDLRDHSTHRTLEYDRIFGYDTLLPHWTYEMFLEHVLPEDRAEVDRRFRLATATRTDWSFECRIRRRDGAVRWIWAAGGHERVAGASASRLAGIVQDITERKQAEQQLQEHAAELAAAYGRADLLARNAVRLLQARQPRLLVRELCLAIMQHLDCQVFVHLLAEPATQGWRLGADAGLDAETAAGIDWNQFGTALGEPVAPAGRDSAAGPGRDMAGKLGLGVLCCQPLTGPGQQRLGLLCFGARNRGRFTAVETGFIQAVADQVALALTREREESALAETNRRLEAANRELEAFSYTVSHDLRAPLRHVQGFSRLLASKHRAELSNEAQEFVDLIDEGATLMGQLVDDLLAFARVSRQGVQRQRVAPGALVRQVWDRLGPERAGRSVEFALGALPECQADPALLKCVWQNLLHNALKFSRGRDPARIEVGGHQQPGELVYYVRDNGVGFDMRYVEKLFGVFQRLHRAEEYEGTGVGLATVQRIIQRHGGRVWAEAELDRGAVFYFSLPVTGVSARDKAEEEPPS